MKTAFGKGATTLTGPVVDGYCIRQSFVARGPKLLSVSILLSTYQRKNPGEVFAELRDIRSAVICTESVMAAELVDNAYHQFKLKARLIPGRIYEVVIRTLHCRSGLAPTAHYGAKVHEGHLFLGSRLVRGCELVCRFFYAGQSPPIETTEEPPVAKEAPVSHPRRGKSVTVPKPTPESTQKRRPLEEDGAIISFIRQKPELLSVIILNKDGYELITECVLGLLENTSYKPLEIIIGDTGSTDERVWEFYRRMEGNGLRVVQGLKYHFSKVNNVLARDYAQGSHLLFLNNDVFLRAGAVDAMMKVVTVYKAGAVGLRLMKPRGVIDHDGQVLYKSGRAVVPDHLNINRSPSSVGSDDIVTQGVTAACMLTRRSLFLDTGAFDEMYEDVYQDCDYCLKLTLRGYRCFTVRQNGATHVGSATRGPTTADSESMRRDREKYLKRWSRKELEPCDPMFSLVTCCNNPDLYSGMMKSLPERNTEDVELIPVANQGNPLTVTQALNLGAKFARGRYIVYCHQDIIFSEGWFAAMTTALAAISVSIDVGIVGFEGIQKGGIPRTCRATPIGRPVEVQTLDELCIVTQRRDLSFDETLKFHYYGADICMEAIKAGYRNYLVGAVVRHLSGGQDNVMSDPEAFKQEAAAFGAKWPDDRVWTTTTNFNGGIPRFHILPGLLND